MKHHFIYIYERVFSIPIDEALSRVHTPDTSFSLPHKSHVESLWHFFCLLNRMHVYAYKISRRYSNKSWSRTRGIRNERSEDEGVNIICPWLNIRKYERRVDVSHEIPSQCNPPGLVNTFLYKSWGTCWICSWGSCFWNAFAHTRETRNWLPSHSFKMISSALPLSKEVRVYTWHMLQNLKVKLCHTLDYRKYFL